MVDRKPEFYDKCCCQENQIPPPVSRYTRWSKVNHRFIPPHLNTSSSLSPASPQLGSWGSFSQRINKALALTTGIILSSPRRTDILHFTHAFLDPLVVSGNAGDVGTLAMKTSPSEMARMYRVSHSVVVQPLSFKFLPKSSVSHI